jgi:ribosomal protein S19E (S16A)
MHNAHRARHAQDDLALQIAELNYALSRHVPAMKRRVRIHTGYGSVEFYGTQARRIAALCGEILRRRLQRLERQGGLPR